MELPIEMMNTEERLMAEIADQRISQDSVAITYAFLIVQVEGKVDWYKVNHAITERWKGASALNRIKVKAWKIIQEWQ